MLVRALIIVLAGVAWGMTVRPFTPLGFDRFALLRWVRGSINMLLPVATIGGDLIGGRLLALSGVAGGLAGASILIDMLLHAITQVLFTLVGLAVLMASGKGDHLALWIALGLIIATAALGLFYLAQQHGLFERFLRWMQRWSAVSFNSEFKLHDSLLAIYAHQDAVLKSVLLHAAAWFVGTAEVWIALTAMGYQPTLAEALVLESLSQAARGAAFPMPGGLGIQEGGFLVLGRLYGIDAQVALALSLVKRVPELVLGGPGLLAWYSLTVRHWWVGEIGIDAGIVGHSSSQPDERTR